MALVPDFEERVTNISKARARENENLDRMQLRKVDTDALAMLLAADRSEEVLALPQMQRHVKLTASAGPEGLSGAALTLLAAKRMRAGRSRCGGPTAGAADVAGVAGGRLC